MANYKTVFTLGILQIILEIFIGASIVTIIFGSLFFLSNLDHDKKLFNKHFC